MPAGRDLLGLKTLTLRILRGRPPPRLCRHCGQPLRWRPTAAGRYRPINADGSEHLDKKTGQLDVKD